MLAKEQHREIADFIMEYNKEGAKILSRYEHTGHNVEEGPNVVIDKVVERLQEMLVMCVDITMVTMM